MEKKIPVYIIDLLLFFVLLVTPMIYTHTITAANSISLLLFLLSSACIGGVVISATTIGSRLLSVSYTGLCVLFGALLSSLVVFISVNALFLQLAPLLIAVIMVLAWRKRFHFVSSVSWHSIVAILVAVAGIVLVSSNEEIVNQLSGSQKGYYFSIDNYFFTAMVASIRRGSVFNAIYDSGSALNYQTLVFFIPAYLADLLHISSHQALWGLAGPFYKVLSLLLGYDICMFFLRRQSSHRYAIIAVSILLPILLAPLHPVHVFRGHTSKFIFNGLGYITPAGVITYPFAFVLFQFCLLLFLSANWQAKRVSADKLIFSVTLAILIAAKGFLFISAFMFFGFIILIRIFSRGGKIMDYMPYVVLFFIVTFAVYKTLFGQSSAGHSHFDYGYVAQLFAGWYGRSATGLANSVMIIGLIIVTYLLWLSIRLLGLFRLLRTDMNAAKELVWGALLTLVAVTVFSSFMRFELVDPAGKVVANQDFNTLGFIRAGFYVVTVVSVMGIAYWLYANGRKPLMAAFVGIWCYLSAASIFYTGPMQMLRAHSIVLPRCSYIHPWYTANAAWLAEGHCADGLIACNPESFFAGAISASDYGTYWIARSARNYNCSSKNEYRVRLFSALLNNPVPMQLQQMKNEGVKYIISTPDDSGRIAVAAQRYPGLLVPQQGSAWVYELR